MNEINQISEQMNLLENELLILEPIIEEFHPIGWLQSVGQFLNFSDDEPSLSTLGKESVQSAVA